MVMLGGVHVVAGAGIMDHRVESVKQNYLIDLSIKFRVFKTYKKLREIDRLE